MGGAKRPPTSSVPGHAVGQNPAQPHRAPRGFRGEKPRGPPAAGGGGVAGPGQSGRSARVSNPGREGRSASRVALGPSPWLFFFFSFFPAFFSFVSEFYTCHVLLLELSGNTDRSVSSSPGCHLVANTGLASKGRGDCSST